jgi:hypothetical protein
MVMIVEYLMAMVRLSSLCCAEGKDGEGCQVSKGNRQGGGAEWGQSIVQSGCSIMLQPETLLHDLPQLQERYLDNNHKEGLEHSPHEEHQLLLPAVESFG